MSNQRSTFLEDAGGARHPVAWRNFTKVCPGQRQRHRSRRCHVTRDGRKGGVPHLECGEHVFFFGTFRSKSMGLFESETYMSYM